MTRSNVVSLWNPPISQSVRLQIIYLSSPTQSFMVKNLKRLKTVRGRRSPLAATAAASPLRLLSAPAGGPGRHCFPARPPLGYALRGAESGESRCRRPLSSLLPPRVPPTETRLVFPGSGLGES